MKLIVTLFVLCFVNAVAQEKTVKENSIRDNSFYYPHTLKNFGVSHNISFITAKLPEDVIESDELFRAPLFVYRIKMGYLKYLSADASITSNIVANHFSAGTYFNFELKKFGFSAGADAAYWFGVLNEFGYKSITDGFNVYPNISVGYAFPNFSLTMRSELMYILKNSTRHGEIKAENTYKTFSGYSFAFYLEQPLWKGNFLVLGVKGNFLKFYYPLWAALPRYDRFFYIPEFIFSLTL